MASDFLVVSKSYAFDCPQCGASLLSALPEKVTAVSCDACGHVFLAKRPAGKKKKARPEDVISIDSNNTEGTASSLVTIASRSSTWSGAATALPLSLALLEKGDDSASEGVIAAFESDPVFKKFAKREMRDILARDKEDDEKLAAGIEMAVAKQVVPARVAVEPVSRIDVTGKSADTVAAEILAALGDAPSRGCILVLQGLSGTGKGTTVAKLQKLLPRAVAWSNGNVFRALTLLAVNYCEQHGLPFNSEALTPTLLTELMRCLTFGKFGGKFDIRIRGAGVDALVSEVQNTTLKEPRVGKNIPTVAQMTQGEVINFAASAAAAMQADGMNVLMEGRAQTLNHVRTPHRFELCLAEPLVIGMRRAAQRMMAAALSMVRVEAAPSEPTAAQVHSTLQAALSTMAEQ